MGVDCRIVLPDNVRLRDVADVIAILAGNPKSKHPLDNKGSYSGRVQGVETKGVDSLPECARILFSYKQQPCSVLYHFEPEGGKGRLLMPRSTAFWIAIGRGLVRFFGGSLDYNDCDSRFADYHRPWKSAKENCPSDGKAWHDLQNRKLALRSLTPKDLEAAEKVCAYKAEGKETRE